MYAMLLLLSPMAAAALSFVLRGDAVLSVLFGFAALGVVSFAGFVYDPNPSKGKLAVNFASGQPDLLLGK